MNLLLKTQELHFHLMTFQFLKNLSICNYFYDIINIHFYNKMEYITKLLIIIIQ